MFRDFHFVQKWNKVKIKAKIKSSNHQKLNYYWWNVYKCYFATLLLSLLCFRMTGAPSLALTSPTRGRSSLALAPSTGLLSWSDVRCQITFIEEKNQPNLLQSTTTLSIVNPHLTWSRSSQKSISTPDSFLILSATKCCDRHQVFKEDGSRQK